MNLSNLLQAVYLELGQLQVSTATAGDTTFVTDSKMIGTGGKDDVWKNGAAFIIEDAAGAGAAPEGEYDLITAYDDSTGKFTAGFTVAPASGDIYGIVSEYYPLYTMIELCNAGLRGLGDLTLIDTTTLDTASNKTEYAAATTWKRRPPQRIDFQGDTTDANDNRWIQVFAWEFIPAAPGTAGLIIFRDQFVADRGIRVWYYDKHPRLNTYADSVAEVIAPELAVATCVERALRWQNSRLGGGDDFLMQRWNDAKQDLAIVKRAYPIWHPQTTNMSRLAGVGREDTAEDNFRINP